MNEPRIETLLAQAGLVREEATGSINTPIYMATVYRHPALGESTGFDYARTGNPTRRVLEAEIARLEGGARGFAFASGMAAIQAAFSLFGQGDHLLVSMDLYGGTYRYIEQVLRRYGLTATYVNTTSLEQLEAARRPETKGLLIETPTNPQMHVTDLQTVCAWAREEGILSIIDNTLMTPYYQRPLEFGADLVLHSATKYLGGHNDVLAGLVVTRDEALGERITFIQNTVGAVLSPFDSWLLLRGMKTLALRLRQQSENAQRLAEFLASHPLVSKVYYTGLPSHPGREIHLRQASGHGGLFSFRVLDQRLVAPLLRSLKVISFAESLGGVETLMTYPAMQTHADMPEEVRQRVGVDETLLRIAVGIEHVEDLLADLAQALDTAEREVNGG